MFRLVALLLLIGLEGFAFAQDKYLVLMPKEIRPGLIFSFQLQFLIDPPSGSFVSLSLRRNTFRNGDLALDQSQTQFTLSSNTRYYSGDFNVPDNLRSGTTYYFHVQFASTNFRSMCKPISVVIPKTPTFITTDKPVYKPRDNVQFMVGSFDYLLLPKRSAFKVQIKDPKGNVILLKTIHPDDEERKSMFKGEMALPTDPILGEYSISVEGVDENTNSVRTFTVEEYVLPKFKVTLNLVSNFAVTENGRDVRVLGKVTSTYTYGEQVHGVMLIFNNNTTVQKVDEFNGLYQFDIPMEFNQSANGMTTIKVVVHVYERHTYIMANDTAWINIYNSHFAAHVKTPTPYRTLSESFYTCMVTLTNANGGQLLPWDGPRSLNISYYQLKYSVNGLNTSKSVVANPTELTIPSVIENVTVNFSQPIKIWFEYRDTHGKAHNSIADILTPMLYHSNSDKPLRVRLVETENETVCFSVTPCKVGDMIFYQIVNKYYPEQLHVYTCSPVGRVTCFISHPVHAPVSVIVAHKVEMSGNGKELLAASSQFSVPFTTQQMVQVEVKPFIQRPGRNVSIGINTTGQTWTGYAAVDTSAELLGRANDITLDGIQSAVEVVNLFEIFKENHLPVSLGRKKRSICYRCGGYTKINTDRILQDAGLSYITDLATFGASGGTKISETTQQHASFQVPPGGGGGGGGRFGGGDGGRGGGGGGTLSGVVLLLQNWTMPPSSKDRYTTKRPVYTTTPPPLPTLPVPLPVWEQDEGKNNKLEHKTDDLNEDGMPVRNHFPETWLWNLDQTDLTGSLRFTATVPDTITSWKVKAFAFNADYGIGVAPQVEVTVFREFFLSMNLPYAVIKGEEFDLQLLVFNYKPNPVRVQVDLDENVGFKVVTIDRSRQNLTSLILVIGPSSSSMASIPISPNIIGDLLLRATATDMTNSSNTDTVERILTVKPEGREVADSRELPPVRMSDGRQIHMLPMSTFLSVDSSSIVEDSFRLYLFVTGDIMGSTLYNLEGLIRMPVGCGEQNMKLLAPNIFVAMYLDAVDRFDAETKEQCVKYSEIGYMRQQKYRHTDGESTGGFSVWGQRHPYRSHASTWLTAFVLKSFSQLAQVNLTYVSKDTLRQAFQYLKRMSEERTSEAFFHEKGRIIHTEMQGGISAGIGLTAFCLITVMDFRDLASKDQNANLVTEIDAVLDAGLEWLRSKIQYLVDKRKPYPLALTAYALAKASSRSGDEHYQKAADVLEEFTNLKNEKAPMPLECPYIRFGRKQVCDDNVTACESDHNCTQEGQVCCFNGCARTCLAGRRPHHISGPSEIEMYGYALMAYTMLANRSRDDATTFDHLRKAEEISHWLISKRKAGGNFETTQDTVVGLESLARFAIETQKNNQAGFRVRAIAGDQYVSEWLTFTSEDYMTTKSAKLDVPSTPPFKDLQFVYDGTRGKAYTTVEALYNTRINRESSPFEVVVNSHMGVTTERIVQTCVRNRDKNLSISPMVTVTVSLGSGYRYVGGTDESSTTGDLRVSKVETDENKSTVTYYYMNDEVDNFSTVRCYNCTVKEDVEIKNRKPGNVRVLDYYNPNNTAEIFFDGTYNISRPTSAGNLLHITHVAVVCISCLVFLQ